MTTKRKPARVHAMPEPAPGEPFSVVDAIARFRGPMTVQDLAPVLGVKPAILYGMVREGKIPAMQIPGSKLVRFDPAAICHWYRRHNSITHQLRRAS